MIDRICSSAANEPLHAAYSRLIENLKSDAIVVLSKWKPTRKRVSTPVASDLDAAVARHRACPGAIGPQTGRVQDINQDLVRGCNGAWVFATEHLFQAL
jgi:hypothetical protein